MVEYRAAFTGVHKVNVYDLSGKNIFTQLMDLPEGDNRFEVNPVLISAGVYILKVTDQHGFVSFEKICIQ